jgi:hypothetical protein
MAHGRDIARSLFAIPSLTELPFTFFAASHQLVVLQECRDAATPHLQVLRCIGPARSTAGKIQYVRMANDILNSKISTLKRLVLGWKDAHGRLGAALSNGIGGQELQVLRVLTREKVRRMKRNRRIHESIDGFIDGLHASTCITEVFRLLQQNPEMFDLACLTRPH